jgi:uncharacterized protein YggE
MFRKTSMFILFALLVLAVGACTSAQAAPATEEQQDPTQAVEAKKDPVLATKPRTITVVGEGSMKLKPDVAQINVGAEARAETVAEAKAEVDAQMEAITAALLAAGVEENDIQTDHYGIHYEREPIGGPREGPNTEYRESYFVTSMLRVTVRDVDKAGDVLDAVVQAGANQVHGVSFTVSDEDSWESQARAAAMADAKSRAQELADLAGLKLGEVLTVSEIIGSMPPVGTMYERPMGGGGGMAPGELEVGTRIQVMFAAE